MAGKGAKCPWNCLRSPFSLAGCILVVAHSGDGASCFMTLLCPKENEIFTGFSVPSHFCLNMKESSESLNRKRQVLSTALKHFKTSTEMADSMMEHS